MAHRYSLIPALFVILAFGVSPARAASSTASLASDSVSTSVGSVSDSFKTSSDSSSKTTGGTAGNYEILEVAAAVDRPGRVMIRMQSLEDRSPNGAFILYVPQAIAVEPRIAPGHIVTAKQRPYGMEFAHAANQEAFFLVLNDSHYQELQTNAVRL